MRMQSLEVMKVLPILRRITWSILLASLLGTTLSAQEHHPYRPFTREKLRDQKYVLFILCTDGDDKRLEKQFTLLKQDWPKLTARGVVVMDEYEVSVTPEAREDFQHYKVKKGAFMVVLADKHVKTLLASDRPVPSAKLFQALEGHPASKRPQR